MTPGNRPAGAGWPRTPFCLRLPLARLPADAQTPRTMSDPAPPPAPPETTLDVKGLSCPLPVLRANRTLRGLAPGSKLRVITTDRASVADFAAFCKETGHALIASSEENGVFTFVIRARSAAAAQGKDEGKDEGKAGDKAGK